MPKVNYPFLCGVDWLQLYGKFKKDLPERGRAGNVSWIAHEFPTPQFKAKLDVYFNDGKCTSKFCEVLFSPRLTSLPLSAAMLKVENKWLYTSVWFSALSEIMSALGLEYVSISRIDVFYDCIKFQNGLRPRNLIADYILRKVLKIGINRGYIAFNDWGYNIPVGTKKDSISVHKTLPNVNGITWGNKGYIQTQIYNKSLELREKKYKEWISRSWADAGLIGNDVWRCEIRIQKQGKSLQLMESGDLFALGMNEVSDEYRIFELFLAYAEKQLRFVRADYHAKKQQMKKIDLFSADMDKITIKPRHVYEFGNTNKTLRVVVNYLAATAAKINETMPDARIRSYATRLTDAADTLELMFKGYDFGERKSKVNPEFRWLSAHLMNEKWKENQEQVKRAGRVSKMEIATPVRSLFNMMHAQNAPTPSSRKAAQYHTSGGADKQ